MVFVLAGHEHDAGMAADFPCGRGSDPGGSADAATLNGTALHELRAWVETGCNEAPSAVLRHLFHSRGEFD